METVIANLIPIIPTVISGMLLFMLQAAMKENKKLREERKKELQRNEVALRQGLLSLLRIQMIGYHEKYTGLGCIPSYVLENWDKMFEAYTELGGNGMMVEMDKDMRELAIKRKGKKEVE